MSQKIAALALAALAALSSAGCSSLSYVPPQAASLPKTGGAPLPLTVSVAPSAKGADALVLNYTRVDPARTLAFALQASGLFRAVRFAAAPGEADLLIAGDYDLRYVIDQSMTAKVGLCMLILPGFFVTFTDNYAASAVLEVRDASGRPIKTYSEKGTVDATYQMFSETTADRAAPEMTVQNLVAKLVADLIADRSLLQRSASAAPQASSSDGSAPAAPAGKTWWK